VLGSQNSHAPDVLRVLLVDLALGLRATIERTLGQAGMEVVTVEGLRLAIERMRQQPFDAVICDLRGATESLEFVRWVGGNVPSTRMVLVASPHRSEFIRTVGAAPNVRLVDELDPSLLPGILTELGPRRGFHGNSIEIELFDYVQMIALTGGDKLIEVRTPLGVGLIWFEHGDIVHVQYQNQQGEGAFYKLLSVGKGEFSEDFGRPPPARTVTRSSTHLLMEAARQADEGILGLEGAYLPDLTEDEEVSFAELNELRFQRSEAQARRNPALRAARRRPPLRPSASDNEDEDFAGLVADSLKESRPEASEIGPSRRPPPQGAVNTLAGHTIFDDPDMRQVMLEQFWQFEGINGVAIISSTGKVLAEDMRNNSSLVTLAGFYMRGAARIARSLGHNVFDGVVARSINGQQMVMISMGAASAVLSVASEADPEAVRDAVMGVD